MHLSVPFRKVVFIKCCLVAMMMCGFIARTAAQPTEMYFDYNWKPCKSTDARFYSVLDKTDSGWLRTDYYISGLKIQMKGLFEDSACTIQNGNAVFYFANGNVSIDGREIHNKREGICLSFYSNGMMSDSATYHNNLPVGNRMKWHRNGFLSDSIAHVNDSMDVDVSWFDNGLPASAGYLLYGKMHGTWQFFHQNSKLAASEVYDKGLLKSEKFFDENGNPQADTSKVNTDASFKGGLAGWKKYLENTLEWPQGYQFQNGNLAVVAIDLTVNEDGTVDHVEVGIPFHPAFDKIALQVVARSPKWQPRIAHNRRIKSTFRQPVIFSQPD